MRTYIRILLPAIAITLMITSCHPASERHDQQTQAPTNSQSKDTIVGKAKTEVTPKYDFDLAEFVHLTDSLLSHIEGESIALRCMADSFRADRAKGRDISQHLLSSDGAMIRRYSFAPDRGDTRLHFWFAEAVYPDTAAASASFEKLHQQAGPVSEEKNDMLPGLTYTNDYVIMSENKIYWLNTGCAFAFFNHQKISQFLLRSLQSPPVRDSIWCQCGQPNCSL